MIQPGRALHTFHSIPPFFPGELAERKHCIAAAAGQQIRRGEMSVVAQVTTSNRREKLPPSLTPILWLRKTGFLESMWKRWEGQIKVRYGIWMFISGFFGQRKGQNNISKL
jgi:hypothetical protein